MTPFGDDQLLAVWERARIAPAPARAAELLAAAVPAHARAGLGCLRLGEVNRLLLALHASAFGPAMACVAVCPGCGGTLEFDLDAAALAAGLSAPPTESAPVCLEVDDWILDVRAPTLDDCMNASCAPSPAARYGRLLAACVQARSAQGAPADPEMLAAPLMACVDERLAEIDPSAEIEVDCACPDCGCRVGVPLDVGAFLWSAVEGRAAQLLGEVHVLASRYGWSEECILAMSGVRRRHYLALALQ